MLQIFDMAGMIPSLYYPVSILLSLMVRAVWGNYVQNGGFESPLISGSSMVMQYHPSNLSSFWMGYYQLIGSSNPSNPTSGQCIQLSPSNGDHIYTGYLQQNISIDRNGSYNISYNWGIYSTLALVTSDELTCYWNGNIVNVLTPTVKNRMFIQTFLVTANIGTNNLKLQETRNSQTSSYGFLLCDVSVEYVNATTSPTNTTVLEVNGSQLAEEQSNSNAQRFIRILCGAGSLPRNMHGLKSLMFYVDQLWLYVYDDRNYTGLLETIFHTVQRVEALKWSIFNFQSKFSLRNHIHYPNYSNFSNSKYKEIEGIDGLFIRSVTPFCLVTLPQTLICCLLIRLLFHVIRHFKISTFLRRYCFMANIFQILLQPNIGFFTYLFFNQMKISFCFGIYSKMYLVFTIMFWAIIGSYSLCFYCIVSHCYRLRAGYFLHNYFRTVPGIMYATIRRAFRPALIGAFHSMLFDNYRLLIFCLCACEIFCLLLTLYTEYRLKVYLTRARWVIAILYHSIFTLLNLSLPLSKDIVNADQLQMGHYIQKIIIYSLGIVMCLDFILDFIPIDCFKLKRSTIEDELENTSSVHVERKRSKKKNEGDKKSEKKNVKFVKFAGFSKKAI